MSVARDPWNKPIQAQVTEGGDDENKNKSTKTSDNANTNASIDDKAVDDIWNDIKNENSADPNKLKEPQTVVTAPKPEEQLKTYLDSIGLQPIALTDQDKEQMKSGEFDAVISRINNNIQTAHIQSLKSANTLIEAKVAKAVEEAVGKSKSIMAGDKMLGELNSKLTYTKNPAIGPVAQTIMQRFLDRGASVDEAIKGVDKWFKKASEAVAPQDKNPNLNSSYRGNNSSEADWIDILSPKS